MAEKNKIIIIVGPTASGKSKAAMRLAERFNGEIINADSMQVYKFMDIGTAKPSKEDRERVPHHLIDIRNPGEDYDAAQFRDEAAKAIRGIADRGNLPIVVGGTGLYIKVLTEGIFEAPGVDKGLRERLRKEVEESGLSLLYEGLRKVDPEAARKIGPDNTHRIIRALEVFYLTGTPISRHQKAHAFSERHYDTSKIGLCTDRGALYKNIDERVDSMIKMGLIDEVRSILRMGYGIELKSMQSLGYSHICGYLRDEHDLGETIRIIKRDTRRYAKRQMTWFKKDHEITWFDTKEEDCIEHIFSEVGGFIAG